MPQNGTALSSAQACQRKEEDEDSERANGSMMTYKAIPIAVFSVFFYACGSLCIFKTKMLVERGRRNYDKYKFAVRVSPFSSVVMSPGYSVYIRCCGIFIWLWALAVDYFAFIHPSG